MSGPDNQRDRPRLWAVTAAVVAVGMVAALGPALLRGPAFVERISFINRGPFDIHVEVTGDPEDGWRSIGTADAASTSLALEVIDEGSIWVFRFSGQGRDGGKLRITRNELRQAQWTVDIPEPVTDRLREAGAPPSP